MARSKRTTVPRRPFRAAALLLAASVSWNVSQTADPLHGVSREDLDLKGAVRMVLVEEATIFSSSSGTHEGPRVPVERIVFDEDGLVTEWAKFGRSGAPASTRRYTYSDGRLTLEEEYLNMRRSPETIAYTHDEDGGRTTAEVRTGSGTLRQTIVYERDGEGKLTSVTEYDGAGAETTRVMYTYTADGKRADRYDPEGEITSWSIETFDTNGRLVEISLYTPSTEDAPFTISYEYDEHGNVTLEQTSGQFGIGLMVITTSSETKASYEYTYDEVGNWVEQVKSVWVSSGDEPHWQTATATYRSFLYEE